MKFIYKHLKYLLLGIVLLFLIAFASLGPRSYDRKTPTVNQQSPVFNGRLKIITYDASLLDLRLLGTSVYQSGDFIEQRAQVIPRELLKRDADIIALQEVFSKEHIDFFIEELKPTYPFFFFKHNSQLKLNNGLLIFSKYPFVSTTAESHNAKGSFDEWLIADSGILSAVIALNDQTKINIINLHATPGGLLFKGNKENAEQEREKQLSQALKLATASEEDKQIILGDINAGPNTATRNYRLLLEQGFTDAYQQFGTDKGLRPKPSWSIDNPLNSGSHVGNSSQQRIDHIFLSEQLKNSSSIIKVEIILDDPIVKIEQEFFPPSNHYGIEIELQL